MCINVLLASSVKWEFCLASAWEESPQHFAQEANVVSLTAEGWFLPKGQDLSCTLDSWCRLDHWAIKPSFPTIVPKEEWWVMFSKPYQFLTSLFLQWPLLLHSSYLNFEVLVLLNWFPGWQSLCFWSCWFSRAHLHLFHVGEYSPSAVPAEQLRGPTALSESRLSQRPPAKDLQARGLLTVLYTFFFFFFLSFCLSHHVGVFWPVWWEVTQICCFIKRGQVGDGLCLSVLARIRNGGQCIKGADVYHP